MVCTVGTQTTYHDAIELISKITKAHLTYERLIVNEQSKIIITCCYFYTRKPLNYEHVDFQMKSNLETKLKLMYIIPVTIVTDPVTIVYPPI